MLYWKDDTGVNPDGHNYILIRYLLCPSCAHASVWHQDTGDIIPGGLPGRKIEGLPETVESVYEEARKCFSVGAYTASELLCRKIIMNVAVEKNADGNKSFKYYITYLSGNHYIHPDIMDWADKIRKNGNESTHEIDSPDKKRAHSTLDFTRVLLEIIYAMPKLAEQY